MKKKILKTRRVMINDLDIRAEIVNEIMNLLVSSQLEENQSLDEIEGEAIKDFVVTSLHILSLSLMKFILGLPFEDEDKLQMGKEIGENICENIKRKLKGEL